MTCQSWRSEKNPGLDPGPHSSGLRGRILFRLPTLTGHSFAAPWVTMTKSGSFESPKPYLLVHNLKNSRIPLLTSIRMSWKVAIYYTKRVFMILNRTPLYKERSYFWARVHFFTSIRIAVTFGLTLQKCLAQYFTTTFTWFFPTRKAVMNNETVFYKGQKTCKTMLKYFFCLSLV